MVHVSVVPVGSSGVCLTGEWSCSAELKGFFDLLQALAQCSLVGWRHLAHGCGFGV